MTARPGPNSVFPPGFRDEAGSTVGTPGWLLFMMPTRPHVEGNLPSESSRFVSEEAEPPASDFPMAQSREGALGVGRGHKRPDPRDTSAPQPRPDVDS